MIFPISAFVAPGFEHSIANMYVIALALMSGTEGVTVAGFLGNLIPVTGGNIVVGAFVAGVYWLCYRYRASGSVADESATAKRQGSVQALISVVAV